MADAEKIALMDNAIQAASFGTKYKIYSVLTNNNSLEICLNFNYEHTVELKPIIEELFLSNDISDNADVCCVWSDREHATNFNWKQYEKWI
ncbi:MAG: hypothetical protein H8D34_25710 [Chloroflexi bacterium]|nr:hypothetical protein [Chloroflexota bacterium]